MPTKRRRYTFRPSPELQALIDQAPDGIRWRRDSWLAERSTLDGQTESRGFSAETIGYAKALKRAIDWCAGKKVPERYDGIDLTRVDRRRITLCRRLPSGGRRPVPRFEVQIERSKGCSGQWMRIYLGTAHSITQARIDRAIATLHLRMERFRDAVVRGGREKADKGLDQLVVDNAPPQRQLLLADVLAWTGKGDGISYSPRATVDATRSGVFTPELAAARVPVESAQAA